MTVRPVLKKLEDDRCNGRKLLAVLMDPDVYREEAQIRFMADLCNAHRVDLILVGGSLIAGGDLGGLIAHLRRCCALPIILFPGSNMYFDPSADALLFLSLISGRNPEYLIGQHVVAAPFVRSSRLEVIPTGYILVGEEASTTVAYISQTMPIPRAKSDVAACTAMAGEMLGMRIIYLDAGSGAQDPVPKEMISVVREKIDLPLWVGGGINSPEKAAAAWDAGADLIVLGNGLQDDPRLLIGLDGIRAG